jgi:hypothetical protein
MISRPDLLMLGISAAVTGCLIGGMMLGVGMFLAAGGANIGWLVMLPAAPVAGLIGWLLARRLARQLEPPTG